MSTQFEKSASEAAEGTIDSLVKMAEELGIDVSREEISDASKQVFNDAFEDASYLCKEANVFTKFIQTSTNPAAGTIGSAMKLPAGRAMAGAGAGAGMIGAIKILGMAKSSIKRRDFERALEEVLISNPILKQEGRPKVEKFAETVFRFAPNVASDPNLLSTVLANAVHGESMDTTTIKSLTELEAKFNQYSDVKPRDFFV